ncbi:XRE family transcriptional regulator [Qipengyuania gaetbuli]|uniref:helix-turn-helix domain-containing protein n=1 Tax=Qipengyuania gaetbuli TaxID=266952 RepID=UPI001C995741|nr:XRE family transcriptional regulator [Qipengyuania gaetbuli]MBY6013911.1 XRE family transcriptional regulator [Qipengyuania gaetbuli]
MEIAGEQLRLARLAHGYSLEALGERVGASRQYLHLLETDARTPARDLRLALCDVLGVTEDFLTNPLRSTVRPEQCHFRGHITRPASVTSQVLARGTMLDRLVAELEKYVDLPEVSFPDIPTSDNESIEKAAESARRHWGLGLDGPIVSMMRVVENAGAVVTYFGDLSERVDAFSMDRRRPILVRSSLKESLCRQRFDFAHEVGHLIMHRGVQTGDRETENQAHRFAGAFLFPRAAFLREFPRGRYIDWIALARLKLRWKVSMRAMVRRAYDLRILSAAQYRTANIHFAKTGQTKKEKYDDDPRLPVEQPELLPMALQSVNEIVYGGVISVGHEIGFAPNTVELISGLEMPNPPLPEDPKIVRLR